MSISNTSKHPGQRRYPHELRERAVRMQDDPLPLRWTVNALLVRSPIPEQLLRIAHADDPTELVQRHGPATSICLCRLCPKDSGPTIGRLIARALLGRHFVEEDRTVQSPNMCLQAP